MTTPSVTIRPAVSSDAPPLTLLFKQVAGNLLSRGINQWQEASFTVEIIARAIEHDHVFVAHSADKLAGTVRVQWSDPIIWGSDSDSVGAAYVHRLAVSPDFSGQGVGLELLTFAEQFAKTERKTIMRLDCWGKNERLIRYYKSAGYTFLRIVTVDERVDNVKSPGWLLALFEKVID